MNYFAKFLSIVVFAAMAVPGWAEQYRLVPGDRVTLQLSAQGTSDDLTVDIDGQLRVAGAGGVTVAGDTLDIAEDRIEQALQETGIYLNPDVSLTITAYAPVIVAGDVLDPGQFNYIPGMTIGGALAMSGGNRVGGTTQFDVERAVVENEAGLLRSNLDIAGAVLRIARLNALLEGQDAYVVPDVLLRRIPAPGVVPMDVLRQAEIDLFNTSVELIGQSLQAWDEEIKLIENQLELFGERIVLQAEVLAATERDLEVARDLNQRGLQTNNRLNLAEQRNADARARTLELEAANLVAIQALSEARRNRANFLRLRREEWLANLRAEQLRLEEREISYAMRTERQVILTGGQSRSPLMEQLIELSFQIVRPSGADVPDTLTEQTRILPGDLLIVTSRLSDDVVAQ